MKAGGMSATTRPPGSTLAPTWQWLWGHAKDGIVDVGPQALAAPPVDTLAPVAHAPILFPAYLDRFCMTSPLPSIDPDVSVFLHGFETRPADVEVVWRVDLDATVPSQWRDIVALLPPMGREALHVSLAAAARWLRGLSPADLADLEGGQEDPDVDDNRPGLQVLRWRGTRDEDTVVVGANGIRPGDTIVVPASYGGCDGWGWASELREPTLDLAERVSLEGEHPVLRLHPAVLAQHDIEQTVSASVLVPDEDDLSLLVPDSDAIDQTLLAIRKTDSGLALLAGVLLEKGYDVIPYPDAAYSGGVLVISRLPSKTLEGGDGEFGHVEVLLHDHREGVAREAGRMATAVGLEGDLARLIEEAARRHDEGKRDPRFQRLLAGSPTMTQEEPLAKGHGRVRDVHSIRRRWAEAGLPPGFRHEAVSAALIGAYGADPRGDLVRHLVASHHGHARPFLPPVADSAPWIDTSELERVDGEVPECYWRLVRRYGWWGLAYLESVLRLADRLQSAEERQ